MRSETGSLYEFGKFRFDGGTHRLWQDKELILLSPKASELLQVLLERRGEFISKREIFDLVWAETFVEDGVLTQNIYTLRKALGTGEDGLPLIENKTHLGYRITAAVQTIEKPNGANGNKILPAAQPQTAIVNKEITQEDSPKFLPAKPAESRKRNSAILAAILILSSVAAIFGYLFLRPQPEIVFRTIIENIRFQKITDTGDILFPTLSRDGNLAAYKKGGSIFVKDLRTGAETKLEISNVKRFGSLQFSKDNEFLYLRNRASFYLPSNVLKVSRFGGEALTIAENVWSAFSLSPDEKQIAFVRSFPNENRQSLIVKNIETGGERVLFELNAPQEFSLRTFPAWSPDGKTLVNAVRQQHQGFLKIAATSVASGQTEDIAVKNFREVEQIVWLPKRDAFVAAAREGKNSQLWEISRDGSQVRRLTNDLNNYRWLAISDDGTKLITAQVVFFSNVWVIDEENADVQKQLTFGTSNNDGYNGIDYFSGGEIVYASNEGASGEVNLWRVNPNDNQRRQLTAGAGSRNENPVISPDDKFIYFASNRGGKSRIWRIESAGENPKQITSGENFNETFPNISADGKYLYFIRKDTKSSAVWRKSLTDNSEEKMTNEKQFAPTNFLALSPDGKHLAFQNLTERIDSENTKQSYQIAVLETANPQVVKFFSIGGAKVEIYWTSDSQAFDFLDHPKDKDEVWRLNLDEKIEVQVVRTFPKEQIFFIARPTTGTTIAVARGQHQNDAVLLTSLE